LFSLGSVLYTLATGFPPFRAGSAMGVLHRIINDPPRRVRETVPDFPPALEAIVMQLLEKNPARRFPSAADVANRLTDFLAAAPDRPKPRRGWPAAAALGVAAALLIAGVVLTFRTPKGTLVVEVNDPAVKVALDGEELTITGAGAHEVRFKIGTYQVTAHKDGKPVQVSQEVVTITRDGRPIVTVKVEPAANLPPVAPLAGRVEALLKERIKTVLPDGKAEQLDLMLQAWRANVLGGQPSPVIKGVPVPEFHTSFRHLGEMMALAAKLDADPDRAAKALRDAYALAGAMLTSTVSRKAKGAGGAASEWEDRQKKLVTDVQAIAGRLVKTPAGRVVLIAGPGADPDKVTAHLRGDDAFQAKRLLALRDQFGLLVPQAQKEVARWEKAKLEADTRQARFDAGLIQSSELEAAKLDVKHAEQALRWAEDTMTRLVADLKKLADEIEAAGAAGPEADFKKVMAEYDALTERLVKTPVGRLLATFKPGYGWGDAELQNALSDKAQQAAGRRLLTLRDQIGTQSADVRKAVSELPQYRTGLDQVRAEKPAATDTRGALEDAIRVRERAIRFGTEAIRGMVADLKKLADELDPAGKAPAPGEDPRFQKVRELKDQINRIETYKARLAELTDLLRQTEQKVRDLDAKRKGAVEPKQAAQLDRELAAARRYFEDLKDELAETTAAAAKLPEAEPMKKQLDQLRKEIADSQAKKAPEPAKGSGK
jgi:hypothetical protein